MQDPWYVNEPLELIIVLRNYCVIMFPYCISHVLKVHFILYLHSNLGVDPTAQLMRFARDMRGSTLHVDLISLGRGQGPKAEELISKAQILKGRWIFLQNCHLAASFMPRLQDIVEG